MQRQYYKGTTRIINLATEVGLLIGIVDATNLRKPQTELRKRNRIKTIRASLAIEGNTLTEKQVTDIIENKRVLGAAKEIVEVQNAIQVYNNLTLLNPFEEESYLEAHKILLKGLIEKPGQYRTQDVGIWKGDQMTHMAPPHWNVHNLMAELFAYLKEGEDNLLIKSCVFHYEMEFIHPFEDGNGRMGRLWQTLILMQLNPVFEFLPIETQIKQSQQEYYAVLSQSDKEGLSTVFIEYLLHKIKISLEELVSSQREVLTDKDRIQYYVEQYGRTPFTRKDYMQVFKNISTATASRDLKKGVAEGLLKKTGDGRLSRYQPTSHHRNY